MWTKKADTDSTQSSAWLWGRRKKTHSVEVNESHDQDWVVVSGGSSESSMTTPVENITTDDVSKLNNALKPPSPPKLSLIHPDLGQTETNVIERDLDAEDQDLVQEAPLIHWMSECVKELTTAIMAPLYDFLEDDNCNNDFRDLLTPRPRRIFSRQGRMSEDENSDENEDIIYQRSNAYKRN